MDYGKLFVACVGALLFADATPSHAKDLLDYVIEVVEPDLAPARPLIECLAGGGNAAQCATEAAKKQVPGALSIGPGDERIKKLVRIFEAARDEKWLKVVNEVGQVGTQTIICAISPVQGPAKKPVCDLVGWIISTRAKELEKVYQALKGPDWWALLEVLGTGACQFIPGEGAAGLAKEALCGPLAAALVELKKMSEALSKGVVGGMDALENLVFGNDSHMPYDRYFELFWQPWYHYSTASLLRGNGLGPAVGGVYNRCVDYFDSHNQYRSTAKKTCSDLRSKFTKHVQGFAAAMPIAVEYFFATAVRPTVREFAISTYGKPATGAAPPGENFWVEHICPTNMRARFDFREPDEGRCILLEAKAKKLGKGPFKDLYANLVGACYKEVKQQTIEPTAYALACAEMRPMYKQAIAGEAMWMLGAIGRMKKLGCTTPDQPTAAKSGLVITCQEYAAHSACLSEFHPNGKKHCRMEPLKLTRAGAAEMAGQPVAGALNAAAAGAAPSQPERAAPAGRLKLPSASTVARQAVASSTDIEAEGLLARGKTLLRGGTTVAQPMAGFGPGWSGDAQLFWHGGSPGATLDLLVDVPRDGAWVVEIALTRAPDYGQLSFEVDQHPVAEPFDGYAPAVAGPVVVSLGTFAMQQGQRPVSLKIVGRNAAATGWLVGIDYIRLRPAGN